MKSVSLRAAVAALLALRLAASATFYPLGVSINGTPFDRYDEQFPEAPQSVYGLRVGLARAGHAEMAGLAVAAGYNRDKFAGGFQIAVFGKNYAESADWGLWQISPFANALEGDGGVVQVSLYNKTEGAVEGLQVGALNIASDPGSFRGVQMGLFNGAFHFSGIQIGVMNNIGGTSGSFSGVQIGLVNLIECSPASCAGVQIGVFNLTKGKDWSVGFVPGLRVIF